MSNAQHTPGQLGNILDMGSYFLGIDWPESDERHDCGSDHHFCEVTSGDPDELQANAERIVACWNACNGLPTENVVLIGKTVADLLGLRDELLEALHVVGMSAGWQYMTMETRALVEAAIAKAKGQA